MRRLLFFVPGKGSLDVFLLVAGSDDESGRLGEIGYLSSSAPPHHRALDWCNPIIYLGQARQGNETAHFGHIFDVLH